jgi:arylsulfatase A-like enzyme
VIIVYADDLGYGDLSCQGETRWSTPRLDAMAQQGVRFTDFASAQPVCSASRTALLTGCYPNRLGIHGALGPNADHGIAAGETTLAELFRDQGYATAAFGKWHLGHRAPFLPTRHGFDTWYGIPYSNDMGPANKMRPDAWPSMPTFRDEEVVELDQDQAEFTDAFTAAAAAFMEQSLADGKPFFVYLAHPMPHTPIFVSPEGEGASGAGLYGDVMVEIDRSVGTLLDTAERLGVGDDTLVLFTSDNGPWLNFGDHAGTTGGLREGKGTTFEGGVRVPAILRWPAGAPAGLVNDQALMTLDVLPSLAGLIGAELPAHGVDGQDMWARMTGAAPTVEREFAYYYHQSNLEAVRRGRWKLHLPHHYRTMKGRAVGSGGLAGSYDYSATIGPALFDLEADVNETTDLSAEQPELVAELMALAEAYRADLGDGLTERVGAGVREPGRVAEDDG